MKPLFLIGLVLALAFMPVMSRAADQTFNASQRQAQIDRIKDGLNSPDPTKRIVTLEQAIASKDATLRRIALSTAFASSDVDLRSAALLAAVASSATFVVDVVGTDSSNRDHFVSKGLGSSFEVRISSFDRASNTFKATTSSSYERPTAGHPGAVSGDRLSYEFDLSRLGTGTTCSGVARLQGGSPTLRGTMSCRVYSNTENYDIAINILK